jgi:glucokinase
VIGALELGGSHVSSALVELESGRVDRLTRDSLDPGASRETLLDVLGAAADRVRAAARIGFAVPGPFDHERGICLIRGLAKLEGLYGVDLGAALDLEAEFVNDAEAFLLGEAAAGAACGHDRALGITLGTGLGSAFLARDELVRDGREVPPGGDLHVVPFRGGAVEDVISARGIRASTGRDPGPLAVLADRRDAEAVAAYARFGADLAEFLEPWLEAFRPSVVVVGGGIAGAWRHFAGELPAIAVPAERPDAAALIGAAVWASRRSAE